MNQISYKKVQIMPFEFYFPKGCEYVF
ncbi:CLUMA_CG021036, isoform A [Clunio marinus]|uniref:CLUMA_CG021036, isoform A n=1 Tax=Clunio marinus TaxID=568069 RepID=A0A1J1J6R0_9DIPT|nr:CLUMA_CG021036, isoform A [Clunio marinus]